MAAGHSVNPDRWQDAFDELLGRLAPQYTRAEPRRRARAFVLGLLAEMPRANWWTIAEHAGEATPDGMQHLLARAVWDAVLIVDETGDVKKGTATVGVQRQYTGTAGRVENAQVGVYLVYAAGGGHAFLDRALYLPRSWAEDPARLAAAGVPDDVGFATKPALARAMLARALDAGIPARWVAGDEVYGADPGLRADLHARGVGYVLAVASNHRVRTAAGPLPVADLVGRLPALAWQRHSAGAGAKGERFYDWAWIEVLDADAPGCSGALIRRNTRTGELAYYRAYASDPVPLAVLVRVAGRRWTVEESFQTGKELAGLDEHQVRSWTSWHRWTVLAMLAHAFLAVVTATERAATPPDGLIPPTINEIRRLFNGLLTQPARTIRHLLHWSRWRRRHQAAARASHYRRQARELQ